MTLSWWPRNEIVSVTLHYYSETKSVGVVYPQCALNAFGNKPMVSCYECFTINVKYVRIWLQIIYSRHRLIYSWHLLIFKTPINIRNGAISLVNSTNWNQNYYSKHQSENFRLGQHQASNYLFIRRHSDSTVFQLVKTITCYLNNFIIFVRSEKVSQWNIIFTYD